MLAFPGPNVLSTTARSIHSAFISVVHCMSSPPHLCETVHDADTTRKLWGDYFIQDGQHGWNTEKHQILDIEELDEGQGQTACNGGEGINVIFLLYYYNYCNSKS